MNICIALDSTFKRAETSAGILDETEKHCTNTTVTAASQQINTLTSVYNAVVLFVLQYFQSVVLVLCLSHILMKQLSVLSHMN